MVRLHFGSLFVVPQRLACGARLAVPHKLAGAKISGSKLVALGAGILVIICLNALQILLMTPSEEATISGMKEVGQPYSRASP